MSGTINYLYDPNQAVWVITEPINTSATTETDSAVVAGTIIQIKASVITTSATPVLPTYDVRLESETGTVEFIQADVFSTLQLAINEYEIRLS